MIESSWANGISGDFLNDIKILICGLSIEVRVAIYLGPRGVIFNSNFFVFYLACCKFYYRMAVKKLLLTLVIF